MTFNYDRCIEHFLGEALATHYKLDRQEGRQLSRSLRIFHPYGSIGPLDQIEFGSSDRFTYDSVLSNLRTYTEQIQDTASLAAIRDAIRDAELIVFLGFAFHPNNMQVLVEDAMSRSAKRIFFTRKGISDADLHHVIADLQRLRGHEPDTTGHSAYQHAQTCHELFQIHHRGLTALVA